jgi:hypothetical protein
MSDDHVDKGNDAPPLAPNGAYRTIDGWIALSVRSDAGFRSLREQLGYPAALEDERFETTQGRFDSRDELDAAIAAAVAAVQAAELSQRLRRAGITADPVLAPNQLPYDPHLQARGFFCVVDHPEWGRRPLTGIAWRRAGGPAITISAPPLLPAPPASGSAAADEGEMPALPFLAGTTECAWPRTSDGLALDAVTARNDESRLASYKAGVNSNCAKRARRPLQISSISIPCAVDSVG